MKPAIKINSFILMITVFFMFLLAPKAQKIVNDELTPSWVGDYFPTYGQEVFASILGVLGAYITYRLLMAALQRLIGRIRLVKKWVLGASYVEGTWVGFYGTPDNIYYAIDVYEQTLTDTTLKGSGYEILASGKRKPRANWVAELVNINPGIGRLNFYCNVDFISDESRTDEAITKFSFVRTHDSSPPSEMVGMQLLLTGQTAG